MINRQLFLPTGPLMLSAAAYGTPFDAVAQPEPETVKPSIVAVIPVQGPLVQRWSRESPSDAMAYEWIQGMARWCFADPNVKAVVLRVDSPGGVVSGAFETAQMLREMSANSGKPLYAYVEGQCCSAAYALACSAKQIYASATSIVGSIGVIHPLGDQTKKLEREGLRFVLVTSGERKADGNPLAEITAEAIAATQAHVDELGEFFFAHVAGARALTVDSVRALQAGTFLGQKAASLRLTDGVSTLDRVLALAANADSAPEKPMKLKAAAQAIVDDKDASDDDKKEAKAYLASLESDDEDSAEDSAEDDAPPKDGKSGDDKAEGDDAPKDDKSDDKAKAAAKAGASAGVVSLEPRLKRVEALLAKGEETAARKKLLAARPDLTAAQRKALAAVPLTALPSALSAIPAGKASDSAVSPMAAALAGVTGETSTQLTTPPSQDASRVAMRARMGLGMSHTTAFRKEGDTLILDMLTPVAPAAAGTK